MRCSGAATTDRERTEFRFGKKLCRIESRKANQNDPDRHTYLYAGTSGTVAEGDGAAAKNSAVNTQL